MSDTSAPAYRRILLKLSGEALRSPGSMDNISPEIVARIAEEIAQAHRAGVQIGLVVGGGNFWRGAKASVRGMDRATADYVGMLATVMNALALQSALERAGVPCVVQSAIEMKNVAESFIRLKARSYLDNNKIVIFAAGTGNPFFSTDTTAALRASEINAEVVMKATSVDGVYDADPKKVSGAKRFDTISYQECLERQLKVMDSTAFTLCMDNKKPIIVFDMHTPGNITRALLGEPIGTTISWTPHSFSTRQKHLAPTSSWTQKHYYWKRRNPCSRPWTSPNRNSPAYARAKPPPASWKTWTYMSPATAPS